MTQARNLSILADNVSSAGVLNTAGGGSGNASLTYPSGSGTVAVQGLSTNVVSGTAQASTSGTAITFSSIPSWVKRITVMFNGVSTSGTSSPMVQLGAGSVTSTGYACASTTISASSGVSTYTTGFTIRSGNASATILGIFVLTNISSNNWVCSANLTDTGTSVGYTVGGSISLSGTLDRVVITTVNGTDTFDAGSINILYE